MNLYIAGTESSNPDNWYAIDEIELWAADSKEQVEKLTYKRPVIRFDWSKVKSGTLLLSMPAINE